MQENCKIFRSKILEVLQKIYLGTSALTRIKIWSWLGLKVMILFNIQNAT
jgi:hypothetical protein